MGLVSNLSVATLAVLALPMAWLVPNHYLPWTAAWSEAWALMQAALIAVRIPRAAAVPRPLLALAGLALAATAWQGLWMPAVFAGDAAVASLYLAAWLAVVCAGYALSAEQREGQGLLPLAIGLVFAAVANVLLALTQWLDLPVLSVFQVNMPPGGRPFGNFAQPNNFSTACFMALAALWLLRGWQRVGAVAYSLLAALLVLGMVMAGSRTAWLQMGLWVVLSVWAGRRALCSQAQRLWALVPAAGFVGLSLLWPSLNEALNLASGRSVEEATSAGTRMLHWRTMLDAIAQEPFTGYGFARVSAAQLQAAANHPPVHEHIEHSHNIVLDAMVWWGIPIGLAICALLAWWLFTRLRAARSATALGWMAAILGLVLHGLLELPLEYAYFLLPAGLMMGAVEALHPRSSSRHSLQVPQRLLQGIGVLLMAGTAVVSWDYLRAEESFRQLRFALMRMGPQGPEPPPRLLVLNQLEAYLNFVQAQAKPGMSGQQLDELKRTSERFGYAPSQMRYALAMGLNGQPAQAALTLKRLCHIQAKPRCIESRETWAQLQLQYPQLQAVALPPLDFEPVTPSAPMAGTATSAPTTKP